MTDFEAVPGKGLRGKVAGKVIAGGNADFIRETCALPDDLQQAGIFYMKGAVSEVAAQLGSSEATIYRYLSKLKD
mgnify:CR=1 FL=1